MRELSHDYFPPLTARETECLPPFRGVHFPSQGKSRKFTDFFPLMEKGNLPTFSFQGKGKFTVFSLS